jgi:hypothetical protein
MLPEQLRLPAIPAKSGKHERQIDMIRQTRRPKAYNQTLPCSTETSEAPLPDGNCHGQLFAGVYSADRRTARKRYKTMFHLLSDRVYTDKASLSPTISRKILQQPTACEFNHPAALPGVIYSQNGQSGQSCRNSTR